MSSAQASPIQQGTTPTPQPQTYQPPTMSPGYNQIWPGNQTNGGNYHPIDSGSAPPVPGPQGTTMDNVLQGEIGHHHFMDPTQHFDQMPGGMDLPQELQDAYQRHQRNLEEGARNQGLPPGVVMDSMEIKPWDQWFMDHPGKGNPPSITDPFNPAPGWIINPAPVLDPMNSLPPLPNPQPIPMPAPVAQPIQQPVPQPTGPVAPVTRGKPLQPAAAFSPTTRGGAIQSAPRTNTQTPQARKPLPPARGAYVAPKATGPVRPKPMVPGTGTRYRTK